MYNPGAFRKIQDGRQYGRHDWFKRSFGYDF